jgi:flagellar hook-basal body complex protein FliE
LQTAHAVEIRAKGESMASPILPITSITPVSVSSLPVSGVNTGDAFGSILTDAMNQVESFQAQASQSVNRFLSGEGEELHQVALKTQQADLSLQLFMQVRNKIVSAYQEVMRMQV